MAEPEPPIPAPFAQRLSDFRRRTLPVVVWGVAAVICAVALLQRGRRLECVGIAQARAHEISAAVNGVVGGLEVRPLDRVKVGQVVARLDDAALRARVEISRARMRQIGAELDAARLASRAGAASLTGELLRLEIDEERRRLDASALRGSAVVGEVEVERLALEAARHRALLDEGLVGRAIYDNVRLQHETARRRLEENRTLLAETEREERAAETRRQQYQRELPEMFAEDPVLGPWREALSVEARVLDEIELQREATLLRSPAAGQVTEVLCRQGQAIVPGEPILTVVEDTPEEVVAWLVEADRRDVPAGSRVRITTRHAPLRTAESVVLREGRAFLPMPQRLWRDPRIPDYGRAVVVAAAPALALVPDEMVGVRFLTP